MAVRHPGHRDVRNGALTHDGETRYGKSRFQRFFMTADSYRKLPWLTQLRMDRYDEIASRS